MILIWDQIIYETFYIVKKKVKVRSMQKKYTRSLLCLCTMWWRKNGNDKSQVNTCEYILTTKIKYLIIFYWVKLVLLCPKGEVNCLLFFHIC